MGPKEKGRSLNPFLRDAFYAPLGPTRSSDSIRAHSSVIMVLRMRASSQRSESSYPLRSVMAYSLGPSSHKKVSVASLGARRRHDRNPYSHQLINRSTQCLCVGKLIWI